MELTCPKCHGAMRSYERNGVTVDQCTDCRGIFLDRGELDRLIDAENAWHGEPAPSARPAASGAPASGAASAGGLGAVVSDVLRQAQAARSTGHGSSSSHGKKRKKSFLDEMFG
jgi:Zn-finger nucleic acid-binding protein